MKIISLCAFLYLSLFVISSQAQDCSQALVVHGPAKSSIFIDFAEAYSVEHLGGTFEITMSHKWRDRINKNAQNWDEDEARDFLDLLVSRIGIQNTLKRLQVVSFFHQTTYKSFRERLNFYEKEVGKEKVTSQLQTSLLTFAQGEVDEIEEGIQFLKIYMEDPLVVKEMMMKKLKIFAYITKEKVEDFISVLEERLQMNEKAIQAVLRRSPELLKSKPKAFQDILDFLLTTENEGLGLDRYKVMDILLKYPKIFINGNSENFIKVRNFIYLLFLENLSKDPLVITEKVISFLEKFPTLFMIDLTRLKSVINYLATEEDGGLNLGIQKVIKIFERRPIIFINLNQKNIKHSLQILVDFLSLENPGIPLEETAQEARDIIVKIQSSSKCLNILKIRPNILREWMEYLSDSKGENLGLGVHTTIELISVSSYLYFSYESLKILKNIVEVTNRSLEKEQIKQLIISNFEEVMSVITRMRFEIHLEKFDTLQDMIDATNDFKRQGQG